MNAAWKEPGTYVVTNRALYTGENPIRVTFDGCYPALENMLVSLEYRFYGDGSIRVQMHLVRPGASAADLHPRRRDADDASQGV